MKQQSTLVLEHEELGFLPLVSFPSFLNSFADRKIPALHISEACETTAQQGTPIHEEQ